MGNGTPHLPSYLGDPLPWERARTVPGERTPGAAPTHGADGEEGEVEPMGGAAQREFPDGNQKGKCENKKMLKCRLLPICY